MTARATTCALSMQEAMRGLHDVVTPRGTRVTDKAWTGCRQLTLNFNDGSMQKVSFKFTK